MRPSTSIGTSQCDFDDNRITPSSSGEYQSAGSAVAGSSGNRAPGTDAHNRFWKRSHLVLDDREPGQYDHPVLAGEVTEPEGVVGPTDGAVVVEVEPRRHAGVRRRDEDVRVVDRLGTVLRQQQVVGAEQVDCRTAFDVVELIEQHDVGACELEDRGDVGGLLIVRSREVLDQFAIGGPVQRGVERGDPQPARWRRRRGCLRTRTLDG